MSVASRLRRGALVIATAAGLALPASASAITDTITAEPDYTYSGSSDPSGGFLVDAGAIPALVNNDFGSDGYHNVVATGDGPDGEELFKTALLVGGTSADVVGTQYLTPGSYPFVCTIHVGMGGSLIVSGDGAVPRPAITVSLVSTKLKKVQKGKLKVSVKASTLSDGASVTAKLGNHPLGTAVGIDLAAGQSRTLTLTLDKAAKKSLKGLKKAKIKVSGEVPYGAPVSTTGKLKG